ncbi:PQ loop repeat-domain-containing protein [Lyophyllum atratum]|nr:PQ loop repeat-domain-containing protein [Lyophyllum atratum]
MPVNVVAENVLGTIGTICWSGQLIPQIWKSWREHSTAGLSHWLVLLWGLSGLFLGVYAIVQDFNIPLIVQPQLFGFLCLFSWGQCLYYDKGASRTIACLSAGGLMVLVGSLEVGIVFAVRPSMNNRAIEFFGIFSSIIIAAGLLPQYWEIIKRREVIGISIPFITIDLLGGVFSVLSLVFRPKFDAIAAVAYTLVVVMDALIIIAALILNPLARRRRRSEAERESISSNGPRQMTQSSAATSTCKPILPLITSQSLNNSHLNTRSMLFDYSR